MKVLDYELENLDTFDPDVLEKIENATDEAVITFDEAKKSEKTSVGIRIQCEAVSKFIDTLWGEGTAKKIFGEKSNLVKSLKAFDEIKQALDEDTEKQTSEMNTIIQKYSPNRAQRRAALKK